MKITWIDPKSVLRLDKMFYRAGDEIPADGLTRERIELLKSQKKIRIGEETKKTVTREVYGMQVEASIIEKPVEEKPVEPRRGRKPREEVKTDDDSTEG